MKIKLDLYGNFDLKTSHVLPVLIEVLEAKVTGWKEVEVWDTGKPRDEFLDAVDLSDACVYLTIHDLSELIRTLLDLRVT
jgi:GDP-L-fucose synthase